MERLLIVNADDFGLCKAQNYGIIEAFNNGVVTSTTAMVNAAGIEHAAALSATHPKLAVGMHFVLTLGKPLSAMPGLVRENGELGKWIWEMAEAGTLPLEEIHRELACQFARFIELFGRPPTHIDSHHHVHMIPQIFPFVAAFAVEKDIAMRIDRDEVKKEELELRGARSTQGFDSGFYGDAITQTLFLDTLDNAMAREEQSLEVMCHPSFIDNTILASKYCYPRLTELDVLTSSSLKYAIAERGYRLGSFKDL
ncbi:chitin disaccharide deacetylase [Enterobacteriaceae bacterium H20N1]|uniref:Chitooligosaccharide deacetylase n=1 Tax=Dryocola boscaweniae TaxID=2925397 RepID=A0A9X2W4E3_9ENTR|nr:chitin disaccharide deacetylase [Dryocola boscaweniae]MCT4700367.1 chitin disaccharide deacetylase [Dryocola boscaweniae]MCT4721464.1 chitin disaccharide deacetylase [Dryocola boscaweniae]